MIFTTTDRIDGREVETYLGVVFGDAIVGVNVVRDMFASIRDIVGGRSGSYEKELMGARDVALAELMERAQAIGADAVIGIDIDYEAVGHNGSLLMVAASGTAVRLRAAPSTGIAAGEPGSTGSPWDAPRR
ncbi:MAG: heavy metal-binding domain-containing protein [Acetobacteraceae bacterium]|nr:heavy metal-binding domain-containing protein [Acetobacteraceae bacterium]